MRQLQRLAWVSTATLILAGTAAPLRAQGGASELEGTAAQQCARLSGQRQVEACGQALESAPGRPELWFFLGQALSELNRHAAAAQAYDRAGQVVRLRRDAAVAQLPGYEETVAPFLRDILRFEGQECQAGVRAQRQRMNAILNDEQGIRQLEAAIASGQVAGEELERLRQMRADIRRFRGDPAALDAQMREALQTCRDRIRAAMEQLGATEDN